MDITKKGESILPIIEATLSSRDLSEEQAEKNMTVAVNKLSAANIFFISKDFIKN